MPNTTLDTAVLDAIIRNSDGNVEKAVAKAAFAVEGRAKVNIQQMEAIDTGALLNSVYTSLRDGGGEDAMAAARARNPDAQVSALPKPPDNATAYVGPSVEYGAAVHFGTNTMAGRPYLLEALRQTERMFRDLLGVAVTNGK